MGYVELDMRACRVQLKVNFLFSKVRGRVLVRSVACVSVMSVGGKVIFSHACISKYELNVVMLCSQKQSLSGASQFCDALT